MNNTIDAREKTKMAWVTQNGKKSLIFIVVHKQRKQLNVLLSTIYRRKL